LGDTQSQAQKQVNLGLNIVRGVAAVKFLVEQKKRSIRRGLYFFPSGKKKIFGGADAQINT